MSAGHSDASFNHSCLKVPIMVSPRRRRFSRYERSSSGDNSGKEEPPDKRVSINTVKSYLKFYESIPDYTELHHLSNEEFYSQLESLKITQKRFRSESEVLGDDVDLLNGTHSKGTGMYCSVCCLESDYCAAVNCDKETADKPCSPPKLNVPSDNDVASEMSELIKKNSDYEADRESSTLQPPRRSYRNLLSVGEGDYHGSRDCSTGVRSLPIESGCECETPELCHGYLGMSFRNSRCYHRDVDSGYCTSAKEKPTGKKAQQGNNLTIPLTSRIPLYDKIMEEKEARRKFIHERYSERLRSLVRPFSFTKREEESKRLRMVRSNPELISPKSAPTVRFKAKPVPKNLFSDYAYDRMREDEFYRALRRRVRAEEMLKLSSLPPSMALRERKYLSKSLDVINGSDKRLPKSWDNGYEYGRVCRNIRRDIESDEKWKLMPSKKSLSRSRRHNSTTDSSTEASPYQSVLSDVRRNSRPHSAYLSAHRSNLASVLRIETARKRIEKEMEDKLRESRLKREARFKERLTRMAPDWKALNYDKEEDFALRVAVRRHEDRKRQEKHQESMASMYGRVYKMPPLFNDERFNSSFRRKVSMKSTNSAPNLRKLEDNSNEANLGSTSLPTEKGGRHFESFECTPDHDKNDSKEDVSDVPSHRGSHESDKPEVRINEKPSPTSLYH